MYILNYFILYLIILYYVKFHGDLNPWNKGY